MLRESRTRSAVQILEDEGSIFQLLSLLLCGPGSFIVDCAKNAADTAELLGANAEAAHHRPC